MSTQPASPGPAQDKSSSNSMTALLVAYQFLTVLPPLIRRPFTPFELGAAVSFFPLIGLLLGGILASFGYLSMRIFPSPITAGLVLIFWVFLTGGLHLDGFLDSCDGLFGGYTPEQRLAIMRDERVGSFALAGGVMLLLLKFTALQSVPQSSAALLLALPAARWVMSLAIVLYPYGRTKGLGLAMKQHASWRQALFATICTVLIAWFISGWAGLGALIFSAFVAWVLVHFVLKRIPGLVNSRLMFTTHDRVMFTRHRRAYVYHP